MNRTQEDLLDDLICETKTWVLSVYIYSKTENPESVKQCVNLMSVFLEVYIEALITYVTN
jgi:hypothetical protein